MSSHAATPLLAAGVKGGNLGIDGRGVKDDWKRSLIIGSTSRFYNLKLMIMRVIQSYAF